MKKENNEQKGKFKEIIEMNIMQDKKQSEIRIPAKIVKLLNITPKDYNASWTINYAKKKAICELNKLTAEEEDYIIESGMEDIRSRK